MKQKTKEFTLITSLFLKDVTADITVIHHDLPETKVVIESEDPDDLTTYTLEQTEGTLKISGGPEQQGISVGSVQISGTFTGSVRINGELVSGTNLGSEIPSITIYTQTGINIDLGYIFGSLDAQLSVGDLNIDFDSTANITLSDASGIISINRGGPGDTVMGHISSKNQIDIHKTGTGKIKAEKISSPKITVQIDSPGNFSAGEIFTEDFILKKEGTCKVTITDFRALWANIRSAGPGNLILDNIESLGVVIHKEGTGKFSSSTCKVRDDILLNTSGPGNVKIVNTQSNLIRVTKDGTGKVTLDHIDCQNAEIKSQGSGNIKLSAGICQHMIAKKSGTGKFTSAVSITETLSANTSGPGNMTFVNVTGSVTNREQSGTGKLRIN